MALGLIVLLISIFFNPYALQSMDRLLISAPNCPINKDVQEMDRSWKISDAIVWSLMKCTWFYFGIENHCNVCALYKKVRCHARFDSVQVNSINLWDRASFQNVSVGSDGNCVAKLNKGSNDAVSPWRLLPVYLFQRNPVTIRMISLVDLYDEVQVVLPAMELSEVALNWHDISKPIFDVNLSNITVNLVFHTEPLPLATLELPVLSMRVGGWPVKDILDVRPLPPDEEGLYPRLGVINISNVSFLSHGRHDGFEDIREEGDDDGHKIMIPNEVFLPLYVLTKQACPKGVDQTKIEALLKDAVVLALRKYLLGEGEDTLLETLRKTSTFIEMCGKSFETFIQERGDIMDNQLSQIMNTIKEIVEKLEDEWNGTVNEQRIAIGKLAEELRGGWDAFKHPATGTRTLLAGIEKIVENLEDAEQSWDKMKKDVRNGWKVATGQLHTFRSNIENILEKTEKRLERKWQHATNDAKIEFEEIRNNFVNQRAKSRKTLQNEL